METAYVAMVIVGVVAFGASLLFGADHDMDHDFEIEHEIEVEHKVDHEIHDADGVMGPGKFSMKLITAFSIGFGFGGEIGLRAIKLPGNLSLLTALPAAFVFYYVAYRILKWLYRQHITTHIVGKDLVGNKAIVFTAIKPGGIGEVKIEAPKSGQAEFFRAKAESPEGKL
ncbi:MAG: hypothetical protein KAW12_23040 [Candidatus Aminicenantes bacterium]|nr:hypothetical protein [Candidatus Aminicenantes bacterium]